MSWQCLQKSEVCSRDRWCTAVLDHYVFRRCLLSFLPGIQLKTHTTSWFCPKQMRGVPLNNWCLCPFPPFFQYRRVSGPRDRFWPGFFLRTLPCKEPCRQMPADHWGLKGDVHVVRRFLRSQWLMLHVSRHQRAFLRRLFGIFPLRFLHRTCRSAGEAPGILPLRNGTRHLIPLRLRLGARQIP